MTDRDDVWVPEACRLPAVERPLRVTEFDELFATGLRRQTRVSPTKLRWSLDPAVEQVARELTTRETACCSFFSFSFSPSGDVLTVEVKVPPAQVAVLDALATRAAERAGR